MNVPRFIRRLFREPFDGLRHHAAVEEGVLYRSGQPTPEQLAELIQRHGLRTVVCLRGRRDDSDPDAWERDERAVCGRHGVEFVLIPFNHKNPPSSEQVTEFLELMRDAGRRPVLLHCRLGQQRTGLFCALYRMHLQNVSAEQALGEMEELGFGIAKRRHRRLLEAFETFAPTRCQSAAGGS
jgi:protein tyrosine/serine phosphatase